MKSRIIFVLSIMFLLVCGSGTESFAQITITTGGTAQQMAQALVGQGVIMLNPSMNGSCPTSAYGMFNFNGNPSDIGIDSGIVLTTGSASQIDNPASFFASTIFPAGQGDADLNTILQQNGSSSTTNDACVLEFDFVPAGDSVHFDYVFASEEYPEYACSSFNDVFAFLISGPGFPSGLNNIALVPGTTIPVAINTINLGAGTYGVISNCNNMGPGSPFGQYYVDNQGQNGQHIVYDGFTTVLTAQAQVIPCDTYHLKLAIADAGDASFDSGVFLRAGSLSSSALSVSTFGALGMEVPYTYTVRGCPPGVIRIVRSGGLSEPITIPLQFSGTAVNGQDYQYIPNSVTIPAGDSAVDIPVEGIPVFPPVGPKTVICGITSPYTCNNDTEVISSDTITILDSLYVNILNPDTVICYGQSVNLQVQSDSEFHFKWTPTQGVSDTTAMNVTVTPDTSTTYKISAMLPIPGYLGCPLASDTVHIGVKRQPNVNLGSDVFTCADSVQLNAATSPYNPDETFTWTPTTGLSNPNIRNPIAYVTTGTQTYSVTVNPGAIGCNGSDTITITVLPNSINLLNGDTTVCAGSILNLAVDGDSRFSYIWYPSTGIANDTMKNTTMVATQSGEYTITASYPTCPAMTDSFYLEVQPNPIVDVGPDRTICDYDSLHLYASVSPVGYNQYSYQWTPASGLDRPNVINPIFYGNSSRTEIVTVSTPIGCTGQDSLMITVNPGNFLSVTPMDTGFCPPDSIQIEAGGANDYHWHPADGLNNPNIANPIASPMTSTNYTLIAKSLAGCYDTLNSFVEVYPSAVISIPDSVQIWLGESYQIHADGNALYFSWFPHSGLSAYDISDPVASPQVRTRYFVTARTENGCVVKDSMDVLVNTEGVLGLPNAFTPGSGIDGTFKIEKRGIVRLKYFRVFNRWGNEVFTTSDINQGWDGTYNGKPQPTGVYVYMIDAYTQNGTELKKTGNVTLLR